MEDTKDEYIVYLTKNKNKFYYKNGVLHREEGPAIINKSKQEQYSGLPDEHLYQLVELGRFVPRNFQNVFIETELEGSSRTPYRPAEYYLNGQPYSKKEFEKLKAQIDLKKELDSELSVTQTNVQKTKI